MLQHPRPKEEIAKLLGENGLEFASHYQGLTLAVVIIAFSFTFLGGLYVALVSGDIVAKEVEEGTMRLVLARPVSRVRLLGVKYAACLVYTLSLVAFLGVTALTLASLYRGGLGRLFIVIPDEQLFAFYGTGEGLYRYARGVLCLAYATCVIASLGFMFSCFRMKPAAATILTLSVLFVDLVLGQLPYFKSLRHWFISYHAGFWVRTFLAYPPWPMIARSALILFALSATFVSVGIVGFQQRDLK
ncbi:ABC-2 type transport system permease protein [Phycisphaera mikurensis]|nr:ABC-2 type transport system permease protein [Phycisphaera mikurensis]